MLQKLVALLKSALRERSLQLGGGIEKLPRFIPLSKKTLLLIGTVVAVTVVSQSVIAHWLSNIETSNPPSAGVIHVTGVEIYGGNLTTVNGTSTINWGVFHPGESKTISFALQSMSNMPIKLDYETAWSPEDLERYMNLKWDYNGTTLLPQEQISISFKLGLSVSSDAISFVIINKVTTFDLAIHIYALEQES